jgi:hypothetical protein
MKKFLALFLLVGLAACADEPTGLDVAPQFAKPDNAIENGNGVPSGPHFNLNIIGTSEKNANMTGGNGRRIFVLLGGKDNGVKTKIMLNEGPDFEVLDANGTDDGQAAFQLPHPDPDCDGVTEYSVYYRALGKPNQKALMQTCYEDEFQNTWCATDRDGFVSQITIGRDGGGKPKFENVSKDLLYVDYCTEVDALTGDCLSWAVSPLFGDYLADYWWEYDNYGQRIAQLRFYPVPYDAWSGEEIYCRVE